MTRTVTHELQSDKPVAERLETFPRFGNPSTPPNPYGFQESNRSSSRTPSEWLGEQLGERTVEAAADSGLP